MVGQTRHLSVENAPQTTDLLAERRRDYQILYVANGKTHFWFDGKEEIVSAGHMVLFTSRKKSKNMYIIWKITRSFLIHFTGGDVKNILAYHGISLDDMCSTAVCRWITRRCSAKSFRSCGLCRYGYEDYIASLFNDILLLVDRQQHEQKKSHRQRPRAN